MSDQTLRSALIKLAHAKPELREHLLPLIQKQAYISGDFSPRTNALLNRGPGSQSLELLVGMLNEVMRIWIGRDMGPADMEDIEMLTTQMASKLMRMARRMRNLPEEIPEE